MTIDPAVMEQSFRLAAGELGMCDAAWRFVNELEADGGRARLEQARDALGRTFPVFDAVIARRLSGAEPRVHPEPVLALCAGLRRLVVVGLEARWLDSLVGALGGLEVGVLAPAALPADLERVASNLPPSVSLVGLDRFQRFAGQKSALLTFVYGCSSTSAFVVPEWVRCLGPDVRSQFRGFIGWDLLGTPPEVYPRWLVETPVDVFTDLVTA